MTDEHEQIISIIDVVRDEGSVVVFRGVDDEGRTVTFAADHRPGQAIIEAMDDGETVQATVPDWAVLHASSVPAA